MAAIRFRFGSVAAVSHSVARLCSAVVIVGVSVGCTPSAEQSTPALNRAVKAAASCDGLPAADAYLSPNRLVTRGAVMPGKPTLREAYTTLLSAMGEPPLYCGPARDVTVRLGVLPWTGAPAVVRVSHYGNQTEVTVVKLEAPTWNFPPGAVLERRTTPVTSSDWESIQAALRSADVWNLETTNLADLVDGGTTWIVEIRQSGSYQVVSRANPTDTPLHRASQLILRVAKLALRDLDADAPGIRVRPFRAQPWMPPPPPPSPPRH